MFDNDLDELSDTALLAAAAEYGRDQEHAAVGVLRAALAFADRNATIPGYRRLPGCERFVVYGGDGCPEVAEFAPVEFGAVLGMSSGAAASLMGEALALRHRLPRVWAAVLSGHALSWRARKIAEACLSLSLEAAAIVDRRVAGIVNTVTPRKLKSITTAAIWEADPEQANANAEAAAKTRGVFVAQSDEHGTKRIWVRAAAGDVIRFDATIDDLAWALKMLGDTDDLDQRRAKAIGWICDPAAADQLIEIARHLARTRPPATTAPGEPARTDATDTAASDTEANHAGGSDGMGAFTRQALGGSLEARLAAIKGDAYSNDLGAANGGPGRRRRHTLYVHLTDKTLATGTGVLRVEDLGPLLAGQLSELLGHDQVIIKPVIDLHDQVSVHSYEIPHRIRERVRLRHPVDMFPYSGAEATVSMDQDHIRPYDHTGPAPAPVRPVPVASMRSVSAASVRRASASTRPPGSTRPPATPVPRAGARTPGRRRSPDGTGPPGQTSVDNLIPQSRLHHRAKTFGGWGSRRLPTGGIEWTSPHGFRFVVDHTGTHQVPRRPHPHTGP